MRMFLCVSLLVFAVPIFCQEIHEPSPLKKSLKSLKLALDYMDDSASAINLDAVFCIRRLQEQIEALLKYEPEVVGRFRQKLMNLEFKARKIADRGLSFLVQKHSNYTAKLGFLLRKSPQLAWYPSQVIQRSLMEEPVACKDGRFNTSKSDNCFEEIGGHRDDSDNPCSISSHCLQDATRMKQRGYTLTHQVLFWEMLDQWQCADIVPQDYRDRLCSNVMRDAEITEKIGFPRSHHDLFLEQVGLCGMWGYKDFSKPHWLEKYLGWQEPSGCFASTQKYRCLDDPGTAPQIRVKREERRLSDGCLSHETGVALLALIANVRFEAEKEFAANKTLNNMMHFMK